ncbi:hypothetical protein ACU686_29305 [Yinghuangia aomiensis]
MTHQEQAAVPNDERHHRGRLLHLAGFRADAIDLAQTPQPP